MAFWLVQHQHNAAGTSGVLLLGFRSFTNVRCWPKAAPKAVFELNCLNTTIEEIGNSTIYSPFELSSHGHFGVELNA